MIYSFHMIILSRLLFKLVLFSGEYFLLTRSEQKLMAGLKQLPMQLNSS